MDSLTELTKISPLTKIDKLSSRRPHLISQEFQIHELFTVHCDINDLSWFYFIHKFKNFIFERSPRKMDDLQNPVKSRHERSTLDLLRNEPSLKSITTSQNK